MFAQGKKKMDDGTEEKQIIVECSCGTHLFKIISFTDSDEIYFDIWSSNFCNKQHKNIFSRIYKRLKMIWFAITGKEYRLEEFVLDKEDVTSLTTALQDIIKKGDE